MAFTLTFLATIVLNSRNVFKPPHSIVLFIFISYRLRAKRKCPTVLWRVSFSLCIQYLQITAYSYVPLNEGNSEYSIKNPEIDL